MDLQAVQQGVTALLNLNVALALGCCLSAVWLREASSPWAVTSARRLQRFTLVALALALLADVAMLWLQAALMAELPLLQAGPAVLTVLTASHYGTVWSAGALALAVAAAAALRRPPAGAAALVALALFLLSRSMLSHAAGDGDVSLRVAIDWLHLILISVWVGEVFVAGLFTLRSTARATLAQRSEQARYVEALSSSATVALAGIVASGLYSSWHALGNLGSLANAVGTPYASALLVKLLLVAAAAALGGFNRFVVMPGLLQSLRGNGRLIDYAGRRFARVLQVEAVVLAGVLVAAAVLSSTSPPGAG